MPRAHLKPAQETRPVTRVALQSNRRMKDEVALRAAQNVLYGLRSKIESNPSMYGGMRAKLERAERCIEGGHVAQAGEHIIEIERYIAERDEAVATASQQAEQERLANARGQPTAKAESGVSTRDGWLWLLSKDRFTGGRKEAGRVFREKYAKAQPSIKSCISGATRGGGDATIVGEQSHARFELDGVRKHMISSTGSVTGEALYGLLVAVVGHGDTVRALVDGDARRADAKVIELGFALDLAGVYLGVVRT